MKNFTFLEQPLFALGFRPFFAMAGMAALVLMGLWRADFTGGHAIMNYYPGRYWHAHEMLLGYTAAVIAGFLLTAVRNWTRSDTVTGNRLALLCLLWLYGRILPFYYEMLPGELIALVDFSFLPILAWVISKPLIQARHYRGLVFPLLLLGISVGNALIHGELLDLLDPGSAWFGGQVIIMLIVLMILVIAGRIFPFFTERGLPGSLCIRNPLVDALSIASAGLTFLLELLAGSGWLLAVAALATLLINAYRIYGWYSSGIWYVPLLWVLYLGYAWVMLGFLLKALAAFGLVPQDLVMHAFTVGGIGVLTLGMMARVSLGHTGRVLKPSPVMACGFLVINLAVVFRVVVPAISANWYSQAVDLSSWLWLTAFSLFVAVYLPILVQPRVDGEPG